MTAHIHPLDETELDVIERHANHALKSNPSSTDAIDKLRLVASVRELADRIEEMEDAAAAAAYAATRDEESFPAEVVDRMLAGENLVRVFREYRGMTLAELAREAGISPAYLSEIETGKKPGSVAALKKLATALSLDLDDLV